MNERWDGDPFIVAEVSKNYPEIDCPDMPRLLSQRFERIINVNLSRGYRLQSWQLNRIVVRSKLVAEDAEDAIAINETIVAVFAREN